MQNDSNTQMSLLAFGGLDDAIAKVFAQSPVKNSKGAEVGLTVKMAPRKEIAETLQLKGKANKEALDDAILAQRDAAWRKIRAEISGLNGDWTMAKVVTRTLGSGIKQINLVIQEVKRAKGFTDEQISKAWGIPIEEVAAFREHHAKLGSPVDVESTKTESEPVSA